MLMFICTFLIHSEQNMLAPNLSAVAVDLGMDAMEKDEKLGGGLAGALFLVGAPAAIGIGMAADGLARRKDLLSLVLVIGAAGCGGTALSTTYSGLFMARALTGVSLGGALPLVYSLLGDIVSPSRRTALSGRLGIAMHLGSAGGAALAGVVGPKLGSWRAPFGMAASMMIVLAFAVRAWFVEPPRALVGRARRTGDTQPTSGDGSGSSSGGGGGGGSKPTCAQLDGWLAIFRVRTVALILLQGVPGCVPWGVISAFLPDYLHADGGFTVPEATIIMGGFSLCVSALKRPYSALKRPYSLRPYNRPAKSSASHHSRSIACARMMIQISHLSLCSLSSLSVLCGSGGGLGTVLGGELGQALHNRSPRLPAVLMLCAGSLGIIPMVTLVAATPHSVAVCALLAAAGGLFATQTGPNVRATLVNTTHADQRGLAFATFALCDDLGKGFGPPLVAMCVRRYGRQAAFSWAMLGWLPCALICGATGLTIVHDEVRQPARALVDKEAFSV